MSLEEWLDPKTVEAVAVEALDILNSLEEGSEREALSTILYVMSNYIYNNIEKGKRQCVINMLGNCCLNSFYEWDKGEG